MRQFSSAKTDKSSRTSAASMANRVGMAHPIVIEAVAIRVFVESAMLADRAAADRPSQAAVRWLER